MPRPTLIEMQESKNSMGLSHCSRSGSSPSPFYEGKGWIGIGWVISWLGGVRYRLQSIDNDWKTWVGGTVSGQAIQSEKCHLQCHHHIVITVVKIVIVIVIQLLELPCSSFRYQKVPHHKYIHQGQGMRIISASYKHALGSRIIDICIIYACIRVKDRGSYIHASYTHSSYRHDICHFFYTSNFSTIQDFTRRKRVNRDIFRPSIWRSEFSEPKLRIENKNFCTCWLT